MAASPLSGHDGGKRAVETPEGVERLEERPRFIPAVDIYQTDGDLVLDVDLPGVAETGIDLTLEKNVLTIVGRLASQDAPPSRDGRREYEVGDFERAFTLPDGIDRDHITAALKDGVLTVRLPKATPATRKIVVGVA